MKDTPIKENRWLPYCVAAIGVILSAIIWYILAQENLSYHLFDSLVSSLPWIVFLVGFFLSILIGLSIRLVQLTLDRKRKFARINEDIQKEIAERIRAEDTKQKLEKALLQGQKLQAIGTLAGGIAHDFNNVLYAIMGYVEMSREDVAKDSEVYRNLGKVLDASHRGQELISRILAFSRRQHHEFTPICIKATVESVLSLLRPTIPASVSIELVGMPDDCVVLGNQTQLHQVIVNIINNAVDAMDGEGAITIKFDRISKDDSFLRQFPKIANTNYCKIDITDTGHGMDQTTMQRIFEPFFTTKEVGKGTGLGLATVHAIIQEQQGEIMVTSQLGRGATFTLLLPEYQDKENENGKNPIS
jgi:signal transduction histidine kinase